MWYFSQKFNLTPGKRKAILGIMTILTFTSTQVQAADVNSVSPASAETVQVSQDVKTDVGLTVPVTQVAPVQPQAAPVVATVKPATKPKKKWNTINAADITTPKEYSDEAAVRTLTVPTSAYTSEVGQCDGSPFTTADGSQVRDGIVAANFLPIGTRLRIPQYFGNQVFEVHDRMNARYTYKMDIWMLNKPDALKWGVRSVKIEILN